MLAGDTASDLFTAVSELAEESIFSAFSELAAESVTGFSASQW